MLQTLLAILELKNLNLMLKQLIVTGLVLLDNIERSSPPYIGV